MKSIFGTGSKIKGQLTYPKFKTEELRVLIPGKKYHLQKESQRALEALGHQVFYLPVPETAGELMRELITALLQFRPDMLLTINHIGFDAAGTVGQVLEELQLPIAVWYVDSPEFVLGFQEMPARSLTSLFMWEKMLIPKLTKMGFEHIHYLPLGSDTGVFKPRGNTRIQPFAFVGDSMTRAQKKWNACVQPEQLDFVQELANGLFENRHCDIVANILAKFPDSDFESRANLVAASTWRATARYRNGLLKHFDGPDLEIYGDDNWPTLMPQSIFRGPVNYGESLSQIYENATVNLNATSMQMQTAVNQRVFDVPAAGGFILTDAQEDALEHFEADKEIVTYSDADELQDKAAFYQKNDSQRLAIIQAARARVISCHTYTHRLTKLIGHMRARHG